MRLLTAGALCAAPAVSAAVVTNAVDFGLSLNNPDDDDIIITGGDIDLTGLSFNVFLAPAELQGDGTTRTLTGGTINVNTVNAADPTILVLAPSIIYDGDLFINDLANLDIDAPTALGPNAMVTGTAQANIRLFTAAGTNTYDGTFFSKIDGVSDETTISVVANGEGIFTALPTFDANINLDTYDDFQFEDTPLTAPTLSLGASLVGANNVSINTDGGTLNLANFDFTIGSLSGVGQVTLGSGTLTTGSTINTTYAGIISGTGNLTKVGGSIFTLTGVNTYTGTTTVSEGTLVFEADQTGPTAIVVEDGGILLVSVAQTATPTYTVQSGGLVNLAADLADATPITIDAGGTVDMLVTDQTLGMVMGSGTLDLGTANLSLGDVNNTTFAGDITGDGNLTKVGAGNYTLSGTSTFTGLTTISEGTLTLDGAFTNTSGVSIDATGTLVLNGDLPDAVGVAIAAGGILDLNDNNETLGTITGSGSITLGTGTLTVGTSASNTFDGTISEAGGLTKQGTGTLTLSGAQTYTGATTVSGGTLVANGDLATSGVTVNNGAIFALESTLTTAGADVTVDAGGTLFGDGSIADNLTNNGTVTFIGPGSGDTLNVGGNYTQGSTGLLQVQLDGGGLIVSGTANIDGTLDVSTPPDPANFDISATYQVIQAGSIAGNFTTVTDNFAFLDLSSNNVGGNIEVTLARNAVPLTAIARTNNQTAVATALNGIGAPAGNLDSAIDRILASSEEDALRTYDQLAGAGAATTSTQIAANAANQSHRLLDEVIGVAPGSTRPTGAFSRAPKQDEFDDVNHHTLFSFYQGELEPEAEQEQPIFAGLNPMAWGAFYGGIGDQGDGAEGLDYTRYGLLVGLELESDETAAKYGVSIGVEQSEFDFNLNNGDVDITSIYLSGYTRQPFGDEFYFTFAAALGYHSHESTRNILIGVTPTPANADYNSYSISLAGELSKSFIIINEPDDPGGHPTHTSIEPFARLDYSISIQDGYSESGAGTAGLVVGDQDFDSIRAAFGARVQHQYMFGNNYEATLQARGLVNIALSNSDSDLNVSFVGTPGSNFAIEGSDQDDVYGQIGIGFSIEIDDNWDLHLGIDQQFSSDALGTVLAGGLSYTF
ncbi:MAG: autotransporter domain-containing protein [Planctomycetota bacterium]